MSAVTGKVKFFSEEKGYGFIIPDAGGPEVFCHRSDLKGASILREDDRVSYELVASNKGNRNKAANVTVIQ